MVSLTMQRAGNQKLEGLSIEEASTESASASIGGGLRRAGALCLVDSAANAELGRYAS